MLSFNSLALVGLVVLIYFAWKHWSASAKASNIGRRLGPPAKSEGDFWSTATRLGCRAQLRIKYVDASGQTTERTVDVMRFDADNDGGLMSGFCQLRNEYRTFRMDRIRHAINTETGEIVKHIRKHLISLHKESPAGTIDAFLERHGDIGLILLFVAKADGRFMHAEKVIVARFAADLVGNPMIDADMISQTLAQMGPPSQEAFAAAVARMRQSTHRAQLLQAAEEIVRTQKTVSDGEKAALAYLRQHLADGPAASM